MSNICNKQKKKPTQEENGTICQSEPDLRKKKREMIQDDVQCKFGRCTRTRQQDNRDVDEHAASQFGNNIEKRRTGPKY